MSAHDGYGLPALQCSSIDQWLLDGELDRIESARIKKNGAGIRLKPACDCAECLIHGERVRMPEQHNCEYVRERSKLVGMALVIATQKIGDLEGNTKLSVKWTAEFVRQMDRLSAPLLNGSGSHQNGVNRYARERNHI